RFSRDWSSDVCSSDLAAMIEAQQARLKALTVDTEHLAQKPVPKPLPPVSESGAASGTNDRRAALEAVGGSCPGPIGGGTNGAPRSEERRVGNECRPRG